MPLPDLPDVVPLALAGTSVPLDARRLGLVTRVASLVLGALTVTGYSDCVPLLVES